MAILIVDDRFILNSQSFTACTIHLKSQSLNMKFTSSKHQLKSQSLMLKSSFFHHTIPHFHRSFAAGAAARWTAAADLVERLGGSADAFAGAGITWDRWDPWFRWVFHSFANWKRIDDHHLDRWLWLWWMGCFYTGTYVWSHCMMEDMEAVAHFGLMIFDELPIKSI